METIKRWYSKFLGCIVPRKLETHKEEISFPSEITEEQQSDDQFEENVNVEITCPSEVMEEQQSDDQFAENVNAEISCPSETMEQQQSDDHLAEDVNVKIWLPTGIIEEIVSRLPVKSILRFRSVSKPWHSVISSPLLSQLHLTHATAGNHTALFIPAVDVSTGKRYFLSATHDGGSVTHLMTIEHPLPSLTFTEAGHLNGLTCSISTNGYFQCGEVFVVNPCTRKIFKLPDPTSGVEHAQYFFGFDESRNEHKILSILGGGSNTTDSIHIMIFSMSSYSWRKIDATVNISPEFSMRSLDDLSHITTTSSVCVDSIIYLLILNKVEDVAFEFEILAFDLTTEKFSIVKGPLDGVIRVARYSVVINCYPKFPYFIRINGCMGVVCHDQLVFCAVIYIWVLQDYEKRVWVKEFITLPDSWMKLGCPFPLDSVNMDEIIFSLTKWSSNVISAPIYNMKSRCFRWIRFTLDHPFLCFQTMEFYEIKCYVESIMPLPRN